MADKKLCKSKNVSSEKIIAMTSFASPKIKLAVQRIMFCAEKLPENCKEESCQILESVYKILGINSSFEEYFKIVSGKYRLENQLIEVNTFCEDLCEKLLPFLNDHGIAFSYSIPKEKLFAMTDKERFQNSILHVIINSVKYTLPGNKIFFHVGSTRRYIKILIRDRGKGMYENVLKHCCEPFFSRGGSDSMGLGLALTRYFLKESKGKLKIKSEPEVGTTVELCLPLYSGDSKNVCMNSYSENNQKADIELIKIAFLLMD